MISLDGGTLCQPPALQDLSTDVVWAEPVARFEGTRRPAFLGAPTRTRVIRGAETDATHLLPAPVAGRPDQGLAAALGALRAARLRSRAGRARLSADTRRKHLRGRRLRQVSSRPE